MEDVLEWACAELRQMLGFDQVGEIARKMVYLAQSDLIACQEFAEEFLGDDDDVERMLDGLKVRLGQRPHAVLIDPHQLATDPLKSKGRNLHIKYAPKRLETRNVAMDAADRKQCGCRALDHNVFSICTSCGLVLCSIEGEGSCFFCGSYVARTFTDPNPAFSSRQGHMDGVAGLAKATAHKDKLLQFSSEQTKRTQIIDDQEDFYTHDDVDANIWLNDAEREMAQQRAAIAEENAEKTMGQKFGKGMTVTLDFQNKSVVEEKDDLSIDTYAQRLRLPTTLQSGIHLSDKGRQVYNRLQAKMKHDSPPRTMAG